MIVYLNGQFMPKSEARISPEDRGFLFADGIYEVIRAYDGAWFEADAHFRRLEGSLRAIRLQGVDIDALRDVADELMEANSLKEAALYLQITRGAAPRSHAFPPAGTPPTIYATAYTPKLDASKWEDGVEVTLVPDNRWARCDIKSISLLPAVMANQQAKERGVEEAVFVRDGIITEGSHTNVAVVMDGALVTHPVTNYILPGITREVVLALCKEIDLPHREAVFTVDALAEADEMVLLGTTTEVMPVVSIDGRDVGSGRPGPLTRRLQEAMHARTRALAP